MHIIECKDVSKKYGTVEVLKGLSCNFEQGKHYVIQGASGSGKSTLLYIMGGLDSPTSGQVLWQNEDYSNWNDDRMAKLRNRDIGFIFQFHYLLPTMSIRENIYLPQKIAESGDANSSRIMSHTEIEAIAKKLGIESLFDRYPTELSGGERQRVNLLRAISMRPRVLLCDEPTGNLDSHNSKIVTEILHELAFEFKATLIVITHSEEVAATFHQSTRLHMKDGTFV